jgi:hypothetical protein
VKENYAKISGHIKNELGLFSRDRKNTKVMGLDGGGLHELGKQA